MSEKKQTYEEALIKLEKIIEEIESNEITLDESLKKYQTGIGLIKFCQEKLSEVEQKIKILDSDTGTLKDFTIE